MEDGLHFGCKMYSIDLNVFILRYLKVIQLLLIINIWI